jgi:molecular chaperone GrpE
MDQNEAKIDQTNDKKEAKSSIFDKVLGIKEAKEEKNEAKEEKIITPENRIKELTESLQRLQAEFENFQKRNAKQNDEFKVFANAKLIEDILPVLDSLEQGMQHNKDLVIVYEQLNGILKKKGLEKIILKKGMQFNHDEMECLMQECDEKLPMDAVVNILMNGYKLNGKILRLARVSVNSVQKKEEGETIKEKNDKFKAELKKEETKKAEEKENAKKECKTQEKEKNEHDGITKCDFEIKIMESD